MQSKDELLKKVYLKCGVKEAILDRVHKNLIINEHFHTISFLFGAQLLEGLVKSESPNESAIIITEEGMLVIFTENQMIKIPLHWVEKAYHEPKERQERKNLYQGDASNQETNNIICFKVNRKNKEKTVQRVILKDKKTFNQDEVNKLLETFNEMINKYTSNSKNYRYSQMSDIVVTRIEGTVDNEKLNIHTDPNYNVNHKQLSVLEEFLKDNDMEARYAFGFYKCDDLDVKGPGVAALCSNGQFVLIIFTFSKVHYYVLPLIDIEDVYSEQAYLNGDKAVIVATIDGNLFNIRLHFMNKLFSQNSKTNRLIHEFLETRKEILDKSFHSDNGEIPNNSKTYDYNLSELQRDFINMNDMVLPTVKHKVTGKVIDGTLTFKQDIVVSKRNGREKEYDLNNVSVNVSKKDLTVSLSQAKDGSFLPETIMYFGSSFSDDFSGFPNITSLDDVRKTIDFLKKWNEAKNQINRIEYIVSNIFNLSGLDNFESLTRESVYFASVAQEATIRVTDFIMKDLGMEGYGLVEISRSSMPDLGEGTYVYKFDENKNIILRPVPYKQVSLQLNEIESKAGVHDTYIVFDSEKYQESIEQKVVIPYDDVEDYEMFGTELMQSTVNSQTIGGHGANKPKLFRTMFSEFIFGQSYTMLKHLGRMMSNSQSLNIFTEHEIVDTRGVQLILSNNMDVEFIGRSIYSEFNRVFGTKRKINEHAQPKQSEPHSDESKSIAEQLRELKALLDDGILEEEEFKEMKQSIIEKNK